MQTVIKTDRSSSNRLVKGRIKNAINKPTEGLADLERAIQLNNKQGLYYYEKMKSLLILGQKANALQVLPTVKQFGIPIEPEVQAKLNQ